MAQRKAGKILDLIAGKTMAQRKPADDAYGAINSAGGRQITITAPHAQWVDWAGRALDVHDDMVKALQAAQHALLYCEPGDLHYHDACNQIEAVLRKAGGD
jgi:hypothetical protein